MANYSEIREELQGRTGLLKEYEDDLIERIGLVEDAIREQGAIVPTLKKSDLIGIIVLLCFGIGMVGFTAIWIA